MYDVILANCISSSNYEHIQLLVHFAFVKSDTVFDCLFHAVSPLWQDMSMGEIIMTSSCLASAPSDN